MLFSSMGCKCLKQTIYLPGHDITEKAGTWDEHVSQSEMGSDRLSHSLEHVLSIIDDFITQNQLKQSDWFLNFFQALFLIEGASFSEDRK